MGDAVVSTADDVLSALRKGDDCVVEAVPGGGKTTLLLAAREIAPRVLLLTYNNKLCAEMRRAMASDAEGEGTTCLTFHALCSRCIGIARDDEQMLEWVVKAEEGGAEVSGVPEVDLLLLDEAQDARELYARLLSVCGLLAVQKCVVGDRDQLLYDFDPDFPATLGTLLETEATLAPPSPASPRKWRRFVLPHSHRLQPHVAWAVNAVFGTDIRPSPEVLARAKGDPPPLVEIISPSTSFDLRPCLSHVLARERGVLVLVDRKKGNRPLRSLVNARARDDPRSVFVHGIDDDLDPDVGTPDGGKRERPAIAFGTYWSAKGLQADTCVVIVPKECPRNALYVAMTRATRRMVLVVDPREPNAALCHALARSAAEEGTHFSFASEATRRLVVDRAARATREEVALALLSPFSRPEEAPREGAPDAPGSLLPRNGRDWSCLDSVAPPLSRFASRSLSSRELPVPDRRSSLRLSATDRGADAARTDARYPLVPTEQGEMATKHAIVWAELAFTGVVRHVEDILSPPRLDYQRGKIAVRAGLHSRFVHPYAKDAELIAQDLKRLPGGAYERLRQATGTGQREAKASKTSRGRACGGAPPFGADSVTLALACMAWGEFDHSMRKHLGKIGASGGEYEFVEAPAEWLVDALRAALREEEEEEGGLQFDVRLLLSDGSGHVRTHASCARFCVHVVWEASSSDRSRALVRAHVHASRCACSSRSQSRRAAFSRRVRRGDRSGPSRGAVRKRRAGRASRLCARFSR